MNSHITNLVTHHLKVAKGINENQTSLGAVGSTSARVSQRIFPAGEHNNTAVPSLYMARTRRVLTVNECAVLGIFTNSFINSELCTSNIPALPFKRHGYRSFFLTAFPLSNLLCWRTTHVRPRSL